MTRHQHAAREQTLNELKPGQYQALQPCMQRALELVMHMRATARERREQQRIKKHPVDIKRLQANDKD